MYGFSAVYFAGLANRQEQRFSRNGIVSYICHNQIPTPCLHAQNRYYRPVSVRFSLGTHDAFVQVIDLLPLREEDAKRKVYSFPYNRWLATQSGIMQHLVYIRSVESTSVLKKHCLFYIDLLFTNYPFYEKKTTCYF